MAHNGSTLAAVLLTIVLLAHPMSAQVCEGRPSASTGNVLLGARYASGNRSSVFSVGVTGLGERVYGGATIGAVSYDDLGGSTTTVGGSVGYQLSVGTSGRAQFCPYFDGGIGFGPKNIEGTGADASSRGVAAGVTWGIRATGSGDFGLIPTIGAGFAYTSVKLTNGLDEVTESDSYGQVGIGVGIVVGRQVTALPSITIPFGLKGADPTFGISVSLSLGGR